MHNGGSQGFHTEHTIHTGVARGFKQNILYVLVVARVFKQEHTQHTGGNQGFRNRIQ